MKIPVVPFIAFEEFDNLGVGYIASILTDAGFDITVIDIREGKKEILNTLKKIDPFIVGFSVIFQYHIHEFVDLVDYLRNAGVNCHFSAGGQYASLRFKELFEIIPSLDSVVRFDGEYTFLELVNCINSGIDWKHISSLVFKSENGLKINDLRRLEPDLDNYPFPMRSPLKEYALGRKFATIVAGRGCYNNCIFCSVREYYRQAESPFKRIRKPEKVAEEMDLLYQQKDCSIFLFQDDDFPVKPNKSKDWVNIFCRELKRRELSGSVMWKINCRPDEVEYERFKILKKHGLFLVYLGIEDGTDEGLRLLNKQCTTAQIHEAVSTLKKLEIGFDYGYLPFQPYSTFASVRENFRFLREMTSDGYSGVSFLKIIPLHATPVEEILRNEGRLKIVNGFPDYDFYDESLNQYYKLINQLFSVWLEHPDGLLNISKWARNYLLIFSYYYRLSPSAEHLKVRLREIVAESNNFILNTLESLSAEFEVCDFDIDDHPKINALKKKINSRHAKFTSQIKTIISNFVLLGDFQRLTGIAID